jgi:hypothetical protein
VQDLPIEKIKTARRLRSMNVILPPAPSTTDAALNACREALATLDGCVEFCSRYNSLHHYAERKQIRGIVKPFVRLPGTSRELCLDSEWDRLGGFGSEIPSRLPSEMLEAIYQASYSQAARSSYVVNHGDDWLPLTADTAHGLAWELADRLAAFGRQAWYRRERPCPLDENGFALSDEIVFQDLPLPHFDERYLAKQIELESRFTIEAIRRRSPIAPMQPSEPLSDGPSSPGRWRHLGVEYPLGEGALLEPLLWNVAKALMDSPNGLSCEDLAEPGKGDRNELVDRDDLKRWACKLRQWLRRNRIPLDVQNKGGVLRLIAANPTVC